jgi:hypothetical protein
VDDKQIADDLVEGYRKNCLGIIQLRGTIHMQMREFVINVLSESGDNFSSSTYGNR